ncbi:UDP-N-acetylmuramoyl-L-alanyl-D-glutamate--2,6-diaminopimelate ligase [Candidatus Poriferisocius sp.]|uniref:UDP-N-acetylmuramoyl-L-alanyl-D-glutamate--2, 6-diaminopimelate ligase n=1 Tax=Candidatus Poriferisocius sp. TaxID=3101276 RepID=UPI003B02E49A
MTVPARSLAELAAAAPELIGCRGQATITGLAHDSRVVKPGDLFFCVRGKHHDGHDFAADALGRGAAALVVERALGLGCPELETASVRRAMGPVSSAFYGHPARWMTMIGVTGTNGKTTVVSLLGSILAAAGFRPEVLGTLTGSLTTPESLDLQRRLAGWLSAGVDVVAMEVSSHALHQHRVDGIRFDAAVFTNLTPEHLDYHRTDEGYFAAKARLFTPDLAARAVINRGDEHGDRLAHQSRIPTVGYDPRRLMVRFRTPPQAKLQAGGRPSWGMVMRWRGQDVRLPLMGRFNAANALAAAETALLLGVGVPEVVAGLESAVPVPGRFEVIGSNRPFTVVVDYAHTPDGLAQVLAAARELVTGSGCLRVVFGCGGDRDAGKRPMMGRAAARLADQVIVTSDNPRFEDPETIIHNVLSGVSETGGVGERGGALVALVDRRAAIARGLAEASEGDVVVVAGKGHETVQVVEDREIPFDDRAVIREILGRKSQGEFAR